MRRAIWFIFASASGNRARRRYWTTAWHGASSKVPWERVKTSCWQPPRGICESGFFLRLFLTLFRTFATLRPKRLQYPDQFQKPLRHLLSLFEERLLTPIFLFGFGNHDPGAGRYGGMRPSWDELHPGRSWASKCKPPKLAKKQIIEAIVAYMATLNKW